MAFRVALLGITHESNTFVKELTTLTNFRKSHWLKGEAIRKEYQDAYHELGGMIEVIDREGMELVPVMYAEATPGGTISATTYNSLLIELIDELDKVLPVDGCLVVPHGAGVCESFADMDGHWLSVLRKKLGNDMPIIGTIDPHANVSRLMIASTNALVAYKTNPHVDQREAGKEAAGLMVKMLRKEIVPVQAFTSLPLAISIEQQLTANEPCNSLYAYARGINKQPHILSVSIVLGFPYADVEDMGSSIIVIADNDEAAANDAVKQLETYILKNKKDFNGKKQYIADVLSLLKQAEKPVLLLDMGDNVGGGSPGDSVYLLDALENSDEPFLTFICIYDPKAVSAAIIHQPGETFNIKIGNRPDRPDTTIHKVKLIKLTDGKFTEKTPRHGGQLNFDMGQVAIILTEQGNIVMLTSLRVPPYSLQQLTAFDINPNDFDVIVAKGVNAPIAAYSQVCKTIVQVNTPGVTQADMTMFTYHNRRKPLFPFEDI